MNQFRFSIGVSFGGRTGDAQEPLQGAVVGRTVYPWTVFMTSELRMENP